MVIKRWKTDEMVLLKLKKQMPFRPINLYIVSPPKRNYIYIQYILCLLHAYMFSSSCLILKILHAKSKGCPYVWDNLLGKQKPQQTSKKKKSKWPWKPKFPNAVNLDFYDVIKLNMRLKLICPRKSCYWIWSLEPKIETC